MAFNRRNRQTTSTLEGYARKVENILLALGIDPESARQARAGGFGWGFRRGSAAIEVVVTQHEGHGYFQVLSPLIHLPITGLLPLYRRLLELNLQLTSAALGVHGDIVYVFCERPIEGLDTHEVNALIGLVTGYADELDDKLADEFGGRLYGRV
jgi:hypothetical protein